MSVSFSRWGLRDVEHDAGVAAVAVDHLDVPDVAVDAHRWSGGQPDEDDGLAVGALPALGHQSGAGHVRVVDVADDLERVPGHCGTRFVGRPHAFRTSGRTLARLPV